MLIGTCSRVDKGDKENECFVVTRPVEDDWRGRADVEQVDGRRR